MTLQAIGSSNKNGRLGFDLLYGSETQPGLVLLACSGAINACSSGDHDICSVSFTLTKTTLIDITASGSVVVRVNSVQHAIDIQVDAITPPTFRYPYPNAGGSASGSSSISLGAGAHTVILRYFTQSIGLFGCDVGSQQMTVSYTP